MGGQMEKSFRFEIEEQLFLVNRATGEAALPNGFLDAAKQATGGQVMGDMRQSQIEIVTLPHYDMKTARAELHHLRRTIAKAADEHGLAILTANTCRTAEWLDPARADPVRKDTVKNSLSMIGQHNLTCGLHVHVDLPDPDERITLMLRMLPYLPLFVALVTPEALWKSPAIGLKCFRLAAADGTWVPKIFCDTRQFAGAVRTLVRAGLMPDSSFLWWGIRPSLERATLELRAPDSGAVVDDAIAIAALFRVLARRLTVAPALNFGLDSIARAIAVENKWQTRSNGAHGAHFGPDNPVTIAELLDTAIEETTADAVALGCLPELLHCRTIAGTAAPADVQLEELHTYGTLDDTADSLDAVASWATIATLH